MDTEQEFDNEFYFDYVIKNSNKTKSIVQL